MAPGGTAIQLARLLEHAPYRRRLPRARPRVAAPEVMTVQPRASNITIYPCRILFPILSQETLASPFVWIPKNRAGRKQGRNRNRTEILTHFYSRGLYCYSRLQRWVWMYRGKRGERCVCNFKLLPIPKFFSPFFQSPSRIQFLYYIFSIFYFHSWLHTIRLLTVLMTGCFYWFACMYHLEGGGVKGFTAPLLEWAAHFQCWEEGGRLAGLQKKREN